MIEPETSMEEIKHHESNKKISKDIKRDVIGTIFPQQRKLMGSAQNSSGVHWCRRWVRFDEVRDKVAKVPGQVQQGSHEGSGQESGRLWCRARSGSTGLQRRFRRRFQKRFRRRSGRLWCRASSTGFRSKVPEVPEKVWEALVQSPSIKVPEKVLGGFGAEPGQIQHWSGSTGFRNKVPEKGLGGFGAEPGQVQRGSGEGSGEESGRLWCRARSGSTGLRRRRRRRFREGLVLSKVRFNRVPEKVPEKVWEGLVQSQVGFNRVPEKAPEKVPGSQDAKPSQVQRVPEKVAEKVPEKVLRKKIKNKTLRLLGLPANLFHGILIVSSPAMNCGILGIVGTLMSRVVLAPPSRSAPSYTLTVQHPLVDISYIFMHVMYIYLYGQDWGSAF